jgi:hypothetical protein
MTDLQTKVEKYETRVAQCEEWALQATVGPQRDLYEVLAHYYRELATNFRQVIEKRKAAWSGLASSHVLATSGATADRGCSPTATAPRPR